ncbi:F510_1955 family glycosylhydrolase [Micromonospora globbae]|uniref:F510_1955 family glycosylhydrolase n=1 Tax=Micromonospora globbae TaxID=1894969 RepID=UPI00341B6EAD
MGKAARTKTSARRAPAKPPPGRTQARHTPWRWIGVGIAVVAAAAALVIWQTGRGGGAGTQAPAALTHIHGLGINPADGKLYVATHDGLYQLPADSGPPRLVGQTRQDTMGFTIAGPNVFLASGHPAPSQGGPPHLGLIESGDAGSTWKTLSLSGQADFHALRFRHNTVYGYNSVRGQLIASTDKATWQTRAAMALRDFDVSPTDPRILLATTETGLQRSTDGGATWSPAGGPPLVLLAWQTADRLWGISTTGDILRSADGGTSWNPSGKLAGQATAFAAYEGKLYAAVHEQGIYDSGDGGGTWTQLYRQAG